jgi:hypothetical protein
MERSIGVAQRAWAIIASQASGIRRPINQRPHRRMFAQSNLVLSASEVSAWGV